MEYESDSEQRLQELSERIQGLRDRCLERSAMRVTRELRRLAKSERRLIPYLHANFYLMNDAQSTFEVDVGIELAIETIGLLESEEKARQFQPDFPEAEYEHTVHWMSACAYDNLAKHVAERDGYNSDGVHDAINDGIQVCRRTGKLECVTCFREYAADVFQASGDLEMSLHHARGVACNVSREEDRDDRRWVGADKIAGLLLLRGRLDDARDAALRALELARSYHSPLAARLDSGTMLREILLLAGEPQAWEPLLEKAQAAVPPADVPPDGERPSFDLQRAKCAATEACCQGDHAGGIAMLTEWDRRLTKQRCLHSWFDVRLRLVGMHLLAGRTEQAWALAEPLEAQARTAHDWLTLARLKTLLDGSVPASPLPFLVPPSAGPFAPATGEASAGPAETATASPPPAEAELPSTPLGLLLDGWVERWQAVDQRQQEADDPRSLVEERQQVTEAILDEMLAVRPESVSVPDDAARLIYLAAYAARATSRAIEAWRWAEPFAELFSQHGTTLNVLADLGAAARAEAGEQADEVVDAEHLETLFRASLDLDHEGPRNFARAGFFYLDRGKTGDAERCLARSCRLDRTNSVVALTLAEIYAESDRARDSLAVLDMCLREGTDDPRVAWQAGLTAFQLQQFEVALTYFDRYEELVPDEAWTQYYRAWALLETDRPQEALAALDRETKRSGTDRLNIEILRAWACSQRGEVEAFRRQLRCVLSMRLAEVDYLTDSGLARLFEKLHAAAQCLPPDAIEREALTGRLLESGLAPDELFEPYRKQQASVEGVNFYVCRIRQPLDERWPQFPGCRHGQESWQEYGAVWGVLAQDPDEATQVVLEWQQRCYPLPAEVLDCDLQNEGFTDSPGVVWQGMRGTLEEPE